MGKGHLWSYTHSDPFERKQTHTHRHYIQIHVYIYIYINTIIIYNIYLTTSLYPQCQIACLFKTMSSIKCPSTYNNQPETWIFALTNLTNHHHISRTTYVYNIYHILIIDTHRYLVGGSNHSNHPSEKYE